MWPVHGTLFLVSGGGTLRALDGGTGACRWEAGLDSPAASIEAGGSALLVAAEGGGLAAFDLLEGALLWHRDLSVSQLWIASDRCAIVTEGGPGRTEDTFLALDLATGRDGGWPAQRLLLLFQAGEEWTLVCR